MKFFPFRRGDANPLPADDRGSGKLGDYDYELRPGSRRGDTLLGLADSRPHQDEIARVLALGEDEITAVIPRRTLEEERVDAPMPVRLFAAQRPSGLVGHVPRGLENVVDAALARLAEAGGSPRIPARIVTAKGGLRVQLLMHETRG
ncbi:hypothetical protein [Rathayibacter tritici]|uniref:HIRAN domain-containing protein n=1 Tax=Rathayibacter tritici TaxID=33888 RepID=A0A160KS14_9MICO|nr:hypothetical protein [Rathayibacter tritici]AND16129.1 hypothetical protein A6122_0978 [Rathayibacter tritici]PPF28906.1 hypothetical protein C5C06_07285 [Rathayibacter tritici]PPI12490.1 hypothetical protein C5D07_12850 [Rathayibacter tritici]PPI42489.1 hypothetical protein C5D18_13030 [Rathayibacter tritici]